MHTGTQHIHRVNDWQTATGMLTAVQPSYSPADALEALEEALVELCGEWRSRSWGTAIEEMCNLGDMTCSHSTRSGCQFNHRTQPCGAESEPFFITGQMAVAVKPSPPNSFTGQRKHSQSCWCVTDGTEQDPQDFLFQRMRTVSRMNFVAAVLFREQMEII